ncbi:hypothetical protein SAMN05421772_10720 [Paracoccus saliphilus]|nr:hypothetical protein SAMN05421772_10720 [Paracoccus saliphilus]
MVQFLATLLAGIMSFVVAYWTVSRQEKLSAEKKATADRAVAENAATIALYKLIDCGEILGSMRNLLDEQFITAAIDGYASEPFQIVRPMQGKDYPPERVNLDEVSFLAKSKNIDLISDISLVYRRTINCTHLSETHSRERIALHEWIHSLPGHTGDLNGDIAQDAIPIEFRSQFERRSANLNLIIASWIDQLEDTISLTESVIDRLGKASKAEFGDQFLTLAVQFPSAPISFEDVRGACLAASSRFIIKCEQSSSA